MWNFGSWAYDGDLLALLLARRSVLQYGIRMADLSLFKLVIYDRGNMFRKDRTNLCGTMLPGYIKRR